MNISNNSSTNGLDFIRYFLSLTGVETYLNDSDEYLFVSFADIEQYKIQSQKYKCVVFYDLFHLDDDLAEKLPQQIEDFVHDNKVYLTVNAAAPGGKTFTTLFWDVLFNRSRLVYFDHNVNLNRVWYYASPGSYKLNQLPATVKNKKFIYQCRSKNHYRNSMLDHVLQYEHSGYISDVFNNRVLVNHDMQQSDWNVLDPNQGLYVPIHNSYYDDTCLSVFVESSFKSNKCIHVTEKAWEPFIKGHFILPFSNPGYITHLKQLGFRFPDFIDYSYDTELDCDKRFDMVKLEFDRLMTLDLQELYKQYFNVVEYNRQLIETLPYHKVNFK